jgi:hypothetical protein
LVLSGCASAPSPLVDLGAVYTRNFSQGQNALFISDSEMQISWYPPERAEVFLQTFSERASKNRGNWPLLSTNRAVRMVSGAFPASAKSALPWQAAFHRPPAHFRCSAARRARPESVMSIEAASAVRAAAADSREASRHFDHLRAAERADVRRDQRIEEAKASDAARSRPSDRAADLPEPRPRSSPKALLLDVLA